MEIGTVKKVTDVLDGAGKNYAIYDGVKPNPTVSIVNEAKSLLTENIVTISSELGRIFWMFPRLSVSLQKMAEISPITMD